MSTAILFMHIYHPSAFFLEMSEMPHLDSAWVLRMYTPPQTRQEISNEIILVKVISLSHWKVRPYSSLQNVIKSSSLIIKPLIGS